MTTVYSHTNIIAEDWKKLASFYKTVFSCSEVPPVRKLCGKWLEKGTGVPDACLEGVHLRLPGWGEAGPTLEIYSYSKIEKKIPSVANRKGFGHIAFVVDDVYQKVQDVINHSGGLIGEVATTVVPGVGELTFVYCMDPESNIVELLSWK